MSGVIIVDVGRSRSTCLGRDAYIHDYYAGLNFASRNLLDSAAGGTFMEITLGEATKLLDNIMVNYSQ